MLNDFKINEFYQFVITLSLIIVNVILLSLGRSNNSFELLMTSAVTFWFVYSVNSRKINEQDATIKSIKSKVDTQEVKAANLAKSKVNE